MTREEAIKLLKRGRLALNEEEAEQFCEAYEMAISALEQKSGKWIKWWEVIKHERSEEYISRWKCSVCGKEQDPHSAKFINFCPNCGADMRGAE